MSEAELLLTVESKKKLGRIVALLNLILPSLGYIYCGRWLLGVVALFFVILLAVISFGFPLIPLVLLLVIQGFLDPGRYSKRLVERTIRERADLKRLEMKVAAFA